MQIIFKILAGLIAAAATNLVCFMVSAAITMPWWSDETSWVYSSSTGAMFIWASLLISGVVGITVLFKFNVD